MKAFGNLADKLTGSHSRRKLNYNNAQVGSERVSEQIPEIRVTRDQNGLSLLRDLEHSTVR